MPSYPKQVLPVQPGMIVCWETPAPRKDPDTGQMTRERVGEFVARIPPDTKPSQVLPLLEDYPKIRQKFSSHKNGGRSTFERLLVAVQVWTKDGTDGLPWYYAIRPSSIYKAYDPETGEHLEKEDRNRRIKL